MNSTELFPLAERRENRIVICGVATREFAHRYSIRHLAVEIIPVALDEETGEPILILHRRSEFKESGPGLLDVCGGHMTFDPELFSSIPCDDPEAIRRAFELTAHREAAEEVRVGAESGEDPTAAQASDRPASGGQAGKAGQGRDWTMSDHLNRFGDDKFFFESETRAPDGRSVDAEFSQAWVLGLDPGREVEIWDTDSEGERSLPVHRLTFAKLLDDYCVAPEEFSGGITRILEYLLGDNDARENFENLLGEAARSAAGKS